MTNRFNLFRSARYILTNATIAALFLMCTLSFSQPNASFSGKWTLNLSKSDNMRTKISQTNIITQDSVSRTIEINISAPGIQAIKRIEKYHLDGRISRGKSDDKPTWISAKLSADKQTLSITTYINNPLNGILPESRRVENYYLVNGGKTLVYTDKGFLTAENKIPDNWRGFRKIFDKNQIDF